MMTQQTLQFDGRTYCQELDFSRLNRQLRRVFTVMIHGQWHTLEEISFKTKDPQASVSARLRDLRKPKFGGFTIERRRRGDPKRGLFEYRLIGGKK